MFTNDPIKFNKETNKDKALLCLDPGTKNIGIAISDINKKVATPIEVIKFTKYMDLKNKIKELVDKRSIQGIIIGYPINMDGSIGPKAQSSNSLADNLSSDLKLPILLWDERLSTSGAERILISSDISRKKRKKVIDKVAASYILQGYLDFINKNNSLWYNVNLIIKNNFF